MIGVDTGGTFTDLVRRGDDGELLIYKLLSTPDDPSRAIADGVDEVALREEALEHLVHGTTVATNALLERDGSELAFVTTEGFEDLLALQRQNRPELYNFEIERPEPLVARSRCFGVDERIRWDGSIERELDDSELERLCEALDASGCDAAAVCLLHAYANPAHERAVADAIASHLPDLHVSTSHEVVGRFREYERASTTCVNAYVAPTMGAYLRELRDRVEAERLDILQSSGGRVDVEHAAEYPVHTVLSGPAGGVVGARTAGREVGLESIISLDMGGTSTDVSLCDGELTLTSEAQIDDLPVHVPVVDIHTVGAGGGSIARVDTGGGLRVGPQSAGADPGPACYGRGGTAPTVTDAHVVLGRIRTGHFLGGRMSLDAEAAEEAVAELADELGLGLRECARGILEVADAEMIRALKVISLERGHDPRDFCLVSFGGAGGLHACRLAASLDMDRVLIPRNPGVLSAYGMVHSDFQRLAERTVLEPLEASLDRPDHLRDLLAELADEAVGDLEAPLETFDLGVRAELRYAGQSYEIDVPVDWHPESDRLEDPTEVFESRHETLYGYRAEEREVELVGLRLSASRPGLDPEDYTQRIAGESRPDPREPRRATVGFADGDREADVLDRRTLEAGDAIEGPAVVTEYSGTTVVPPAWSGEVRSGHLLLRRSVH